MHGIGRRVLRIHEGGRASRRRWSLVILRELTIHGARGFDALADGILDRTVVVDLDVTGTSRRRFWVVLERGAAPSMCIEGPCLAGDQYVFVEAEIRPARRGAVGDR